MGVFRDIWRKVHSVLNHLEMKSQLMFNSTISLNKSIENQYGNDLCEEMQTVLLLNAISERLGIV